MSTSQENAGLTSIVGEPVSGGRLCTGLPGVPLRWTNPEIAYESPGYFQVKASDFRQRAVEMRFARSSAEPSKRYPQMRRRSICGYLAKRRSLSFSGTMSE
jgi:hypothetical protein